MAWFTAINEFSSSLLKQAKRPFTTDVVDGTTLVVNVNRFAEKKIKSLSGNPEAEIFNDSAFENCKSQQFGSVRML
jgi:hypothetical protein